MANKIDPLITGEILLEGKNNTATARFTFENDQLLIKNSKTGTNLITLQPGGDGTPGGTEYAIQFNKSGIFSGSSKLTYDYNTDILSGTTATFSSITGSFSGNGSNITGINTANITNFTNNVRAQFSAGSNITIVNGVISSTGGGSGTVTSVGTGTGLTGGPITTTGTISLTGQALALHNLSSNGLVTRTGAGAVVGRTITGGTGITVTNGDGVSENPSIALTNNSLTIGSTSVSLGGTATTIAGLTSVTSTGFTGSLSGNASTAATVALVATNTTNATHYLVFTNGATGNEEIRTDTSLTYNPSTNILTAGSFSGNGSGITSLTASNITNFTSDVRTQFSAGTGIAISSGQISANNIPNSSLQNSSITIGSTSISLGSSATTIQGISIITGSTVTGSTALFTSITGNLQGNAATATTANTVALVPTNTTNATHYINFTDAATGSESIRTDTNLTYNPNSNILTAGGFSGNGSSLTNLTASNVTNFTNDVRAQFTAGTNVSIINGIISAELDASGTAAGGLDQSIQFNSGSILSGSTNLIYDYSTNILSGTQAQFTGITSSLAGTSSYAISAGNASTATNATNVAVTDNTIAITPHYIAFVGGTSGNQAVNVDSSTLTYNPSTNTLTVANLAGNASTATTATNATNVTVTADLTTNATRYIAFVDGTSGNHPIKIDSSTLTYNPSINFLTAGKFLPTSTSENGNGMYLPATNALGFSTDSEERLRITETGEVQIPSSGNTLKCDPVNRNVTVDVTNVLDGESITVTSPGGRTAKLQTDDTGNFCAVGTTTNHTFSILVNNERRAVLTPAGRVGIGLTSPLGSLHVNNRTSTDAILTLDDNNTRVLIIPDNMVGPKKGYQLISNDVNGTSHWDAPSAASRGVSLYDDFLFYPSVGWTEVVSGAGAGLVNTSLRVDDNHSGVIILTTGNTDTGKVMLRSNQGTTRIQGGTTTFECAVQMDQLSTLLEEFVFRIGLGNNTTGNNDHTDGIYFEYDRSILATTWLLVTASGGVRTRTSTGVTVTADSWVHLRFEATTSGVNSWVNGAFAATTNSNIPTIAGIGLNIQFYKTAGITPVFSYVDYYSYHKSVNRPTRTVNID